MPRCTKAQRLPSLRQQCRRRGDEASGIIISGKFTSFEGPWVTLFCNPGWAFPLKKQPFLAYRCFGASAAGVNEDKSECGDGAST